MSYRLPESFYTYPNRAETTVTTKELKELMLHTNGSIVSCGRLCTIKKKSLGGGVYLISLVSFEFEDKTNTKKPKSTSELAEIKQMLTGLLEENKVLRKEINEIKENLKLNKQTTI